MNFTFLNETYGEPAVLAAGGLLVGLLFGFFAQRSKFCLRAAVVEFWHHQFGEKLSVWLLTFASAVIAIQALIVLGDLDVSTARQLATRGSLSGALIGGLLFGAGMIMTRGCASRLLILSANGNLRALLSGLIFAVTAQSALSGALSPLRQEITNLWTVEGGTSRDLLAILGWSHTTGLVIGGIWLLAALYFTTRTTQRAWMWLGGTPTACLKPLLTWSTFKASRSADLRQNGLCVFWRPIQRPLVLILDCCQVSFWAHSLLLGWEKNSNLKDLKTVMPCAATSLARSSWVLVPCSRAAAQWERE